MAAASSLQSPTWTLYWSRTTVCFYSCISKNFTRLYLSACWYLASFLRDNHITDHGPPSSWNSSASTSPHCTPPLLASARLNKHPSTLPRPVPSLFAAHPLSQIIHSRRRVQQRGHVQAETPRETSNIDEFPSCTILRRLHHW